MAIDYEGQFDKVRRSIIALDALPKNTIEGLLPEDRRAFYIDSRTRTYTLGAGSVPRQLLTVNIPENAENVKKSERSVSFTFDNRNYSFFKG